MNIIAEIRQHFHIDYETITSLANTFNLSRRTIRKHLNTTDKPVYQRKIQPHPKLGLFHEQLDIWLDYYFKPQDPLGLHYFFPSFIVRQTIQSILRPVTVADS